MSKQKQAEQAEQAERFESIEKLAHALNRDLIDTEADLEWLTEAVESHAQSLVVISDTVNDHAAAGNALAERMSRLEALVSLQGTLIRGLREDMGAIRRNHGARSHWVSDRIDTFEKRLDIFAKLRANLGQRVTELEAAVFTVNPTRWQRFQWWLADLFGSDK